MLLLSIVSADTNGEYIPFLFFCLFLYFAASFRGSQSGSFSSLSSNMSTITSIRSSLVNPPIYAAPHSHHLQLFQILYYSHIVFQWIRDLRSSIPMKPWCFIMVVNVNNLVLALNLYWNYISIPLWSLGGTYTSILVLNMLFSLDWTRFVVGSHVGSCSKVCRIFEIPSITCFWCMITEIHHHALSLLLIPNTILMSRFKHGV